MQSDIDLADELDARATAKEQEAARLRAAATILRGGPVNQVIEPKGIPSTSAVGELTVVVQRLTELDYVQTIEAQPSADWTADSLADALRLQGKAVASVDAVRTALVRLQGKGIVERTGHGRYKLAQPAILQESG